MTIEPKQNKYGFNAFIAFIVIGFVSALILPKHDYSFSWSLTLIVFSMLLGGLIISVLAFKHGKTVAGKTIFAMLSLFYIALIFLAGENIVKHVF